MRKFRLLFIAFLCVGGLKAQTNFQRTYGGAGDETGYNVIQTGDGGYLISGYTTSFGNGQKDAYVIKTNSSGIQQWAKAIGGAADDIARYAIEDSKGYVIGGTTESFGAGGLDGFITRLNYSGDIVWFKTYGTQLNDINMLRFEETMDQGFVIAYPYTTVNGHYKCTVIKTDSIGNVQWVAENGAAATDVTGAVIQVPDSGFLTNGFSDNFGVGMHDFLISRMSSAGNLLWSKTLGTAYDNGGGYSLNLLDNDEALIAGQTHSGVIGSSDIILIRINYQTGQIIWAKEYGKAGRTIRSFSSVRTQDNGFAADVSDFDVNTLRDMALFKTDSNGNFLWMKRYGGTGDDVAYCAFNTWDNGFVLAGQTNSFGSGGQDVYLVKTDPNGKSGKWLCYNDDTLQEAYFPYTLTSPTLNSYNDPDTSLNISLNSTPCPDMSDNLCTSTTADELNDRSPVIIFPNPSSGMINISMENYSEDVIVLVSDMMGKTVLQEKFLNNITNRTISIDRSGIFIVKIIGRKERVIKWITVLN